MEWAADAELDHPNDHVRYHRWIGGARDLDIYDSDHRNPNERQELQAGEEVFARRVPDLRGKS